MTAPFHAAASKLTSAAAAAYKEQGLEGEGVASRDKGHAAFVAGTPRALVRAVELQALPMEQRFKLIQLRLAAFQRMQLERVLALPHHRERLQQLQEVPMAWAAERKLAAFFLTLWQ
jgi:hypothetical protein